MPVDQFEKPEKLVILEGILTTATEDGAPHVAVMGASVSQLGTVWFKRMMLRPFRSTRTYANLTRTRQAVFHVTDDVCLLARAAIGRLHPLPDLLPSEAVSGWVLADCCRWYALQVDTIGGAGPRAEIDSRVVAHGRVRDYFGLNRAKHAVVEAAVLATRTHLMSRDQVLVEMGRLASAVEKTGGAGEREAFSILEQHVRQAVKEMP
jgi:hypothetical protein